MRTITVAELRQNPTAMLADVERGARYRVTRHQREIAQIAPAVGHVALIPAERRDGAATVGLPHRELRSADSIDELIDDAKGDW